MTPQAKVVILSGIPGSGKSTWAEKYKSVNSWNTRIVSRDAIRENAFPKPYIYTKQNEDTVTRMFDILLNSYLIDGLDVIIDNTNCKNVWIRNYLKTISENFPKYKVYIKYFDVSLWKAAWRAYWRKRRTGKDVPYSVIKDMHRSFKKMDRSQFKEIIL